MFGEMTATRSVLTQVTAAFSDMIADSRWPPERGHVRIAA